MKDRTSAVFGNAMTPAVRASAQKKKAGYLKKYGSGALDLGAEPLRIGSIPNPALGEEIGRASCRERV